MQQRINETGFCLAGVGSVNQRSLKPVRFILGGFIGSFNKKVLILSRLLSAAGVP